MTNPSITSVAITGSVPTQSDNPAVPVTIAEQIENTHAASEAGATIAHCHVRDDDGKPTSDPERFARLKEGIEAHFKGMIVHVIGRLRLEMGEYQESEFSTASRIVL
jgi:uncharacterized protein (DUF849 family)